MLCSNQEIICETAKINNKQFSNLRVVIVAYNASKNQSKGNGL